LKVTAEQEAAYARLDQNSKDMLLDLAHAELSASLAIPPAVEMTLEILTAAALLLENNLDRGFINRTVSAVARSYTKELTSQRKPREPEWWTPELKDDLLRAFHTREKGHNKTVVALSFAKAHEDYPWPKRPEQELGETNKAFDRRTAVVLDQQALNIRKQLGILLKKERHIRHLESLGLFDDLLG
jgi:hypothetical protein